MLRSISIIIVCLWACFRVRVCICVCVCVYVHACMLVFVSYFSLQAENDSLGCGGTYFGQELYKVLVIESLLQVW